MRIRVAVTQLRLGMYLESLEGPWLDHPFWRTRFLLSDPEDLRRLRDSGVTHAWIDTTQGADLPPDPPAAAPAASAEPPPEPAPAPASFSDELDRAARICQAARAEVTRMFAEARMGRAIDPAVADRLVDDIADSVARHGAALISLARLKTADNYTYMHSVAVCALMIALARQLGLTHEQARSAGFAGLVHDIGKMAVPHHVLNKPGRLDDAEFEQVKAHPRRGWEMLRASGVDDAAALDVCLHHHERLDGGGYPECVAADGLSLMARMGAVCDIYDAITSNRPYKAGWDPAESLSRMARWTGGHLDETVFQAFVRSLGIYPVGSLVRLSNDKLAVVIGQSSRSLLLPLVRAFYSLRHQQRIAPVDIDLSVPDTPVRVSGREDPARWRFADLDAIWSAGVRV